MRREWTFQQDNDPNYCTGDSELVPEEENKVVGMAQSITRLKPNRAVKIKIHKRAPKIFKI